MVVIIIDVVTFILKYVFTEIKRVLEHKLDDFVWCFDFHWSGVF